MRWVRYGGIENYSLDKQDYMRICELMGTMPISLCKNLVESLTLIYLILSLRNTLCSKDLIQ